MCGAGRDRPGQSIGRGDRMAAIESARRPWQNGWDGAVAFRAWSCRQACAPCRMHHGIGTRVAGTVRHAALASHPDLHRRRGIAEACLQRTGQHAAQAAEREHNLPRDERHATDPTERFCPVTPHRRVHPLSARHAAVWLSGRQPWHGIQTKNEGNE